MITHIHGDYFADCGFATASALRNVFGGWISVYAAVVAYCVRSIFRSKLVARLLSNNSRNRKISLWTLSPATTPSEAFQLREMLILAAKRGSFSYVWVSLFCIASAIVSAASTTIANHTVVQHNVTRTIDVPGRLANDIGGSLAGLYDRTVSRAAALDRANAPHDQLFDFIPDDNTNWVFVPEEWNNTWRGECFFHKYPAVDLMILLDANSSAYQDLVPALGPLLPSWATLDPLKQGISSIVGNMDFDASNDTGSYRDILMIYAFGSAPNAGNESLSTANIALANILAHHIGTGIATAIKSDVHVAECTFNFNTTYLGPDHARADDGLYNDTALTLTSVYTTTVAEASARGQDVVQPTAEDMLRHWQAFHMVKDGYNVHPVHRTLSVSLEVVQIRLSVVAATVISFILALAAAALAHFREPLDERGRHLSLPKSQLDWIVEAARQHHEEGEYLSRVDYAKNRDDLSYVVSTGEKGLSKTRIISKRDHLDSITQPFLGYFDPQSLYDGEEGISGSAGGAYPFAQPFMGAFNRHDQGHVRSQQLP